MNKEEKDLKEFIAIMTRLGVPPKKEGKAFLFEGPKGAYAFSPGFDKDWRKGRTDSGDMM